MKYIKYTLNTIYIYIYYASDTPTPPLCAQNTVHAALGHPPEFDPAVSPLPLLLLCGAVLLPASTVGGSALVQPPLALATIWTILLMVGVLIYALAQVCV